APRVPQVLRTQVAGPGEAVEALGKGGQVEVEELERVVDPLEPGTARVRPQQVGLPGALREAPRGQGIAGKGRDRRDRQGEQERRDPLFEERREARRVGDDPGGRGLDLLDELAVEEL